MHDTIDRSMPRGKSGASAKSAKALASKKLPSVRRLLVTSPKGGVGKTGFSRNLAVSAAVSGLKVATVDLDEQRTLTHWWERRPEELSPIEHFVGNIADAQEILSAVIGFDLVVIDTPTAVERYPEEIKALILGADFILIPTQASLDDTESVSRWMQLVTSYGKPAAFVLNRVNRRARSFLDAKRRLNEVGRLCPIEVPQYEDVVGAAEIGVGVVEIRGAKGADDFSGVWTFVRNEMRL